jgi:hypothetical protein
LYPRHENGSSEPQIDGKPVVTGMTVRYKMHAVWVAASSAIDPTLETYKQPATLRFEVFTCGAILGRSGHQLVLYMPKNWGGCPQRDPLLNNLLDWPLPTFSTFDSPTENAK